MSRHLVSFGSVERSAEEEEEDKEQEESREGQFKPLL